MRILPKAINVAIIALLLSLASVAAQATPILYFYTDFNNGLPAEFSGATTLESVQGYAGIGTGADVFSGNMLRNPTGRPVLPTVLTLTNLPSHTNIDLHFLFAAIDSWDGANQWGPDYLNVDIDGTSVFTRAFKIEPSSPGETLTIPYLQQLGWTQGWPDHAYNLGIDSAFNSIAHSAETLTISWYAGSDKSWQGGLDESWGIDNVGVYLDVIPTPEPATILLLAAGIAGLALWSKKTVLNLHH